MLKPKKAKSSIAPRRKGAKKSKPQMNCACALKPTKKSVRFKLFKVLIPRSGKHLGVFFAPLRLGAMHAFLILIAVFLAPLHLGASLLLLRHSRLSLT